MVTLSAIGRQVGRTVSGRHLLTHFLFPLDQGVASTLHHEAEKLAMISDVGCARFRSGKSGMWSQGCVAQMNLHAWERGR